MPGGGPITEEVFIAKADLLIARLGELRDRVQALEVVASDIEATSQVNQTREEVMFMVARSSGQRRRSMGRHGAL